MLASAFLDAQLRELLAKSFIDDEKNVADLLGSDNRHDRPLSSFGARIKAAYCMGLIGTAMYDDLASVQRIRNRLAHKMHNYTFDEPEIVNWCKSLKLAKMITDAIPDLPDSHGSMFLLGITQLATWLAMKTIEKARTQPSPPKDPELGQVIRV